MDEQYLALCRDILENGVDQPTRTGTDKKVVFGRMIRHDMKDGFPFITTARKPYRNVKSELEFFIQGKTDKRWLQERGNPIWNEWAHPEKAPYGHDNEAKARMKEERDLGPVYGFQWRHFGAEYQGPDADYSGQGVDQLASIVETMKERPYDTRMIATAWNPVDLPQQALPACHRDFHVQISDGKLNLLWSQRSVDVPLGLPFNIASYATLLHLLAKEAELEEGELVGSLADTHIYMDQIDGIEKQLQREPRSLPRIETPKFTSIFDWKYTDTKLIGYDPHPKIDFPIAV